MKTEVISVLQPDAIQRTFAVLARGGLAAFPTDTVYGLGANIASIDSIERLFTVKGRDSSKAIAVLVGSPGQLNQVADQPGSMARRLAERFWPGPLTLVVSRRPELPDVLSPLPTIGVRMPDFPAALALLRLTGPLATTSANLSGQPSPVSAQDVLAQLDGRIELVLDGGVTPGGLPSTVVDCTTTELRVLREGPISLEALRQALE